VISGFLHDVDVICALLGYYATLSGRSVPMFRDNFSVPSSRVKTFFLDFLSLEDGTDKLSRNIGTELPLNAAWTSWSLKMGPVGCLETSAQNYHSTLRNIPEEHISKKITMFFTRCLFKNHWSFWPQFLCLSTSVKKHILPFLINLWWPSYRENVPTEDGWIGSISRSKQQASSVF
jgi:hypothetical protein